MYRTEGIVRDRDYDPSRCRIPTMQKAARRDDVENKSHGKGRASNSIPKLVFNAQVQDEYNGYSSSSNPSTPATGTSLSTPDTPTDLETERGDDYLQQAAGGSPSTSSQRHHDHHRHSPKTNMTITTTTTTAGGQEEVQGTAIQLSGAGGLGVSQSVEVERDGKILITPIPTRKDRKVKVKKVISFTPRISHFDRHHPVSQGDTFRGFYVLFWLLMGLTMTRVLYHSYLNTGEMVGMRFAKLISEDAIALALSDAVLVGSTILCVPFIKVSAWQRWRCREDSRVVSFVLRARPLAD